MSIQYLTQSYRFVNENYPIGFGQRLSFSVYTSAYNYDPGSLLSFLNPVKYTALDGNGLYIGLLGLAILLLVILTMRRTLGRHPVWKNYKSFLLITMFVAALFMFGYWTFIPAVANYIPLISQVRELGRYSILIQLCLAIMVGIAIEVIAKSIIPYLNNPKRQKIIIVAALFLLINTAYLYLVSQKHGNLINSDFAYENGIVALCILSIVIFSKRFIPIVIGGLVITAILQPTWFVPTIASNFSDYPPIYYKKTPSISFLEKYYGKARVLIDGNALPPNIGDVYPIQTVLGHDATMPINLYRFLNEPDPINNIGEHLNLLNVRFIASSNPNLPLHKVFFDNIRKIYIYTRDSYLPRAFFASQINQCELKIEGCMHIAITQYSDNRIVLHYTDNQPQTLVLSEVDYTGWYAYIDGHNTTIKPYTAPGLRAQLLRSIFVPPGSHSVVFQYKPFNI